MTVFAVSMSQAKMNRLALILCYADVLSFIMSGVILVYFIFEMPSIFLI